MSTLLTEVQAVTSGQVKLAYVDQGYTGEPAGRAAAEPGVVLEVVRLPESHSFLALWRRDPHWYSHSFRNPARSSRPQRGLSASTYGAAPGRQRSRHPEGMTARISATISRHILVEVPDAGLPV